MVWCPHVRGRDARPPAARGAATRPHRGRRLNRKDAQLRPRPERLVRMPKTLVALLALLLLTVCAPSAQAATSMDSVFQDDGLLLSGNPDDTTGGLDRMKALGATTIHALVPWAQVAPGREDVTRPAGFAADDPAAYPEENWVR